MSQSKKEIKCVIWDLDCTLWDGTLAESDDVKLKPGVVDVIKTLDSRGILHSIASKNNFEEAIERLKSFGIDQYFLYPQVGWNAKSVMLANIQENLNIAMDTFLFIDDQPFEREEVEAAHPDITCVDAVDYLKLTEMERCNPRFITKDSAKRRFMYMDDIKRKDEETDFQGTPEAFLSQLDMEFIIHGAKEEDLKRAEELTVRTNQLNATGRTFDYDELNEFRLSDEHKLLVCELTDKYGSYGKIGLALIEIKEDAWHLRLLLMSCRVMSRGVGSVLMSYIMQEAKKAGKKLLADFKHTKRNRQMFISYKFSNFKQVSTDDEGHVLFENDLSMIQPFPPYIDIQIYD